MTVNKRLYFCTRRTTAECNFDRTCVRSTKHSIDLIALIILTYYVLSSLWNITSILFILESIRLHISQYAKVKASCGFDQYNSHYKQCICMKIYEYSTTILLTDITVNDITHHLRHYNNKQYLTRYYYDFKLTATICSSLNDCQQQFVFSMEHFCIELLS